MENSVTTTNALSKKKATINKPFYKRVWAWVLTLAALLVIIAAVSSGGSSDLELVPLLSQGKTLDVSSTLGTPDEILLDNNTDFQYGYNTGVMVKGDKKEGVNSILVLANAVKNNSKNYTLFGTSLGSSLKSVKERLGTPMDEESRDGKTYMSYSVENDKFIFAIMAENDKIIGMQVFPYSDINDLESLSQLDIP